MSKNLRRNNFRRKLNLETIFETFFLLTRICIFLFRLITLFYESYSYVENYRVNISSLEILQIIIIKSIISLGRNDTKRKKKRYLYKRDNGKRSIFNNPCQPKSLCLRFTEVHEGNFCPGLTRDTEMTLEKV